MTKTKSRFFNVIAIGTSQSWDSSAWLTGRDAAAAVACLLLQRRHRCRRAYSVCVCVLCPPMRFARAVKYASGFFLEIFFFFFIPNDFFFSSFRQYTRAHADSRHPRYRSARDVGHFILLFIIILMFYSLSRSIW